MNYICIKLANDNCHIVFSCEPDSDQKAIPLSPQCSKNYRILALMMWSIIQYYDIYKST